MPKINSPQNDRLAKHAQYVNTLQVKKGKDGDAETLKDDEALKAKAKTSENEGFRKYTDREVVGVEIYDALLNRKTPQGFIFGYKDDTVGYMSQLYGGLGQAYLINRFKIDVTSKFEESYIETLKIILDMIENAPHFDASPYIEETVNSVLFAGYDYVDSAALTLSYCVHTLEAYYERNRQRKKNIKSLKGISLDDETVRRVMVTIERILRIISEPVISDNLKAGWGYATGCKEPSLYCTYSVLQAYNDFYDYILKKDEKGVPYGEELLAYFRGKGKASAVLPKRFDESCREVGRNIWDIYGSSIAHEFYDDTVSKEGKNIIGYEQIESSNRSSALFNTLYIIFILFASQADKPESADKEDDPAEIQRSKDIQEAMKLGVQNVLNTHKRLVNLRKDSIVDKHLLFFTQRHSDESLDFFAEELNDAAIEATALQPLCIRLNNLIAQYITKFANADMADGFDTMILNTLEKEFLWEKRKFDLLTSIRYIEALGDFYRYYNKFEKEYVDTRTNRKLYEAKLEDKYFSKMEDENKKYLETEKVKLRAELVGEFKIENEIDKKIRLTAKEVFEEMFSSKLSGVLDKAINNALLETGKVKKDEFTSGIKEQLKFFIEWFILNYSAETIRHLSGEYKDKDGNYSDTGRDKSEVVFKDIINNLFKE